MLTRLLLLFFLFLLCVFFFCTMTESKAGMDQHMIRSNVWDLKPVLFLRSSEVSINKKMQVLSGVFCLVLMLVSVVFLALFAL